jgi:hypothetical protein
MIRGIKFIPKSLRVVICLLPVSCFASTSILTIDATQMQAKIVVLSDQPGFCTYRASRGNSFSSNLPDLTNNGNTDARAGSLINGRAHVFVLGTRKGDDALASAATYWVGATCGADAEVSRTFSTRPIPWGNTAPDPVPFNASKFGNRDYPAIDWSNQQKSYADPITGVEFWRVTGPGVMSPNQSLAAASGSALGTALDASGTGKWAGVANLGANGSAYAVATGTGTDKAFLPLSNFNCFGTLPFAGWQPRCTIDDISFDLWCGSAATAGIVITLQLSQDGGQTVSGNTIVSSACPTTAPVKIATYPQLKPNPPFLGWGFTPKHHMVVPPGGTVNVTGSVVSLQNPGASENYFNTDWTSGTPIRINGAYYHIASIQSSIQLTITEDPGTLTSVPYSGANFGVVVTKSSSGNAVSVSLGLNYAYSTPISACCNGDVGMVNTVPVAVTKSADGTQTLNPALKGYFTILYSWSGIYHLMLWIPYNADGSVRAETRFMSSLTKPATRPTVHTNGDTLPQANVVILNAAFDGVEGNSVFGVESTSGLPHAWKLTYDETLPGCAGYVAYHPFPANRDYETSGATRVDDCFVYNNLTPAVSGRDLVTQMKNAYSTGQNVLGETVGVAHPDFDSSWLFQANPGLGILGGGYFTVTATTRQDRLGLTAGFDTATGVLRIVRDSWNDGDLRWGGMHTVGIAMGSWRFVTAVPILNSQNPATVFNNGFQMGVIKVNRAGAGSSPLWDCLDCQNGPQQSTSIAWDEAYTCPNNLPAPYGALSSTQNCIQVKVSSPPCSRTPNISFTFADGKHEAAEFPCTTPGFGLNNAAWSKLQDMQVGDWMFDPVAGTGNEFMTIMAIRYNSANDIDIWCLRWAGHNFTAPLFKCCDEKGANAHHDDPWSFFMGPTYGAGGTITDALDLSNPASHWQKDNPQRSGAHGSPVPGSVPGLYSFYAGSNSGQYIGAFDSRPQDLLWTPMLPSASYFPAFAGSSNGLGYYNTQSYDNGTYTSGAANPHFMVDFRHLNPGSGNGPELNGGSGIGILITVTPVVGTNQSYLITDGGSFGSSDYKRLPMYGYAGRYLLKDVSSPVTDNTSDLPDYSLCRALNANECFQGSSSGDIYITIPKIDIKPSCVTDQLTQSIPCVFQLAPWAGQTIQFRIDVVDPTGLSTRKFGYVNSMPGVHYQFSNCRLTPEAAFMFCPADWLDGVEADWLAYRLTPMSTLDSVNRTTFVPVPVFVTGVPGATNVRARFGYLENGDSENLFRCTAYARDCSTEIPVGRADDPYSFTNETVTRRSCPAGSQCGFTIPALSNRMLYFVVDHLDDAGATVYSGPIHAVAVP